MKTQKKTTSIRIVAILLAFSLVMPLSVYATSNDQVLPCASYYLDAYGAYIYNAAFGKVTVYFNVSGVNYMDEIGSLNIKIYESLDGENWYWVETYTHDGTAGMLDYNDIYHSGSVTYQGTIGRYYKAYVCIWAGKDGDGDTRFFWTNVVKASLFAG